MIAVATIAQQEGTSCPMFLGESREALFKGESRLFVFGSEASTSDPSRADVSFHIVWSLTSFRSPPKASQDFEHTRLKSGG